MRRRSVSILAAGALLLPALTVRSAPEAGLRSLGLARVDITPDYPVRLSGYAARKTECEGVAQRIWAKALAIGSDHEKPALLICVDNCGIPTWMRDEVTRRLAQARRLDPARVAVCSTHTHSAPHLEGYLTNLFLGPLPSDQLERIGRYTRQLVAALERVGVEALDNRAPGRLSRGRGTASFAANRRLADGPVDREVPVLFVTGREGRLRGIVAGYACHCTTLTGEFNQVCGDWAGYAQEYLERDHPGAVVMVAIGCGGDANPHPRPGFDLARRHGQELAGAVNQVLNGVPTPVNGKLECRTRALELAFAPLPTRADWEQKAKDPGYVGQHARLNLARLDRGEKLPTHLPYRIQTWTFGKDLAWVFLQGEVVSDYSLRLKRECDPDRLWVTAYANGVPGYIPSERALQTPAHDYEAGGAMIYYDWPTRLAPGLEDLIVQTVRDLLPKRFRAPKPS